MALVFAYQTATHFLALVFVVSALAKLLQPADDAEGSQSWINRFTHSRFFPWLEILPAVVLVAPLPAWLHASVALVIAAVVIAGSVIRMLHPQRSCECFGSVTPDSLWWFVAVNVSVCMAACLLCVIAVAQPAYVSSFDGWYLGSMLALAFLVGRKLRYDRLTGVGYAGRWVGMDSPSSVPHDLVLGQDLGRDIAFGELASIGKPILVVNVSTHCRLCVEVWTDLIGVAKDLSRELTIVTVAEGDRFYRDSPSPGIVRLVDSRSRLGRFLGVKARPFALFLDEELELQLPPTTGVDNVKKFFPILLGLTNPKEPMVEASPLAVPA